MPLIPESFSQLDVESKRIFLRGLIQHAPASNDEALLDHFEAVLRRADTLGQAELDMYVDLVSPMLRRIGQHANNMHHEVAEVYRRRAFPMAKLASPFYIAREGR